jgi:hypothetical protein
VTMRQARNQQLAAATAMRLLKYDRARTKARKEDAEAYAAHLIAEFERQLAKEFSFDEDAIWKAAAKSVEAAVEDARRVIAARVRSWAFRAVENRHLRRRRRTVTSHSVNDDPCNLGDRRQAARCDTHSSAARL